MPLAAARTQNAVKFKTHMEQKKKHERHERR